MAFLKKVAVPDNPIVKLSQKEVDELKKQNDKLENKPEKSCDGKCCGEQCSNDTNR
jgi:hypothetical protein